LQLPLEFFGTTNKSNIISILHNYISYKTESDISSFEEGIYNSNNMTGYDVPHDQRDAGVHMRSVRARASL
jgi:hypothetical protein